MSLLAAWVLWLGMQEQATSIQNIQVSEAEPQHCIVGAQEISCTTGMPGITETIKRPDEWRCDHAPAERVFEIRTKRDHVKDCGCAGDNCQPGDHCGCIAGDCVRVTRELFIDGKHVGVVKGLE